MTLEKQITEFLTHVENIGEDKATEIAKSVEPVVISFDDFIDSVVDGRSQIMEIIVQVDGVGKTTAGGIRDLALRLESGEVRVVEDNFGKIRVIRN